jgi:squalene-hopene/tetraprenyl-beta-curcumene cyclase
MAVHVAGQTGQSPLPSNRTNQLVHAGLDWLRAQQNSDGGWGDTDLSISNISTSMLVHAVFHAVSGSGEVEFDDVIGKAQRYITDCGGVDAVVQRYGRDRTFSIPILTHCALAGTVDWKHVSPLPFELACLPPSFYSAVRLPVVSYALPALIAIGQAVFHHRGHWNPMVRFMRRRSIRRSLAVLQKIQPDNGGFLEATPLTSFVCMSLVSCGRIEHAVTRRCLDFISQSVRDDGSWPIDTNLSTWVTTLSVNALHYGSRDDSRISPERQQFITNWLLQQQQKTKHAYTNAAPGGWSWTNLPGAVPDADDTPGVMLALLNLHDDSTEMPDVVAKALDNSTTWLLSLQNRDGGWPTFCRGWGTMPFDRSSNDLTAHVVRALDAWRRRTGLQDTTTRQIPRAVKRGMAFLSRQQNTNGTWLPLWFGNQFAAGEENPLYGTSRVLLAYAALGQHDCREAKAGLKWLLANQDNDGGWSAIRNLPCSVEETGLALEAICGFKNVEEPASRAANWLIQRLESGQIEQPSPIGFYFAKLWYYEKLYPLVFATAGLRRFGSHNGTGQPPGGVDRL